MGAAEFEPYEYWPKWLKDKTIVEAQLTANAIILILTDGSTVALYLTIEDDGKNGWELFID